VQHADDGRWPITVDRMGDGVDTARVPTDTADLGAVGEVGGEAEVASWACSAT